MHKRDLSVTSHKIAGYNPYNQRFSLSCAAMVLFGLIRAFLLRILECECAETFAPYCICASALLIIGSRGTRMDLFVGPTVFLAR